MPLRQQSSQQRNQVSPTTLSMGEIARPDPTKGLRSPPVTAVMVEPPSSNLSPHLKPTRSPGCKSTFALEEHQSGGLASGTMHHGPVVHLGGALGQQSLQQRSTFDETCSDLGDLGSLSGGMNLMPGQVVSDGGSSPAAKSHEDIYPTRASAGGGRKVTVRFTPQGWKGSDGLPSPPSLHLFPDVYIAQPSSNTGDLPFIKDVAAMRSERALVLSSLESSTIPPGHKLAQVSSGHRLKPSVSYRRRSDELSATRSDDNDHHEEPSNDADNDLTDILEGSSTSSYQRRRHGLRGVPFWVKVCAVIAIPLCFLVCTLV
jgi:hypothetical protein